MNTIKHVAAQGDCFFERVDVMPSAVTEVKPVNGRHILAHSETGHHHSIAADGVVMYAGPANPLVCYLRIDGDCADVTHQREVNPHQTIRLTRGLWKMMRQREYVPGGFRRVED